MLELWVSVVSVAEGSGFRSDWFGVIFEFSEKWVDAVELLPGQGAWKASMEAFREKAVSSFSLISLFLFILLLLLIYFNIFYYFYFLYIYILFI